MPTVTYERGAHRFYHLLLGLLLNSLYAVLGAKASRIVRTGSPEKLPVVVPGSFIILGGFTEDVKFTMTEELLDAVFRGKVPERFSVDRFRHTEPPQPRIVDADDLGHTELIGAVFVNYYESVVSHIEQRYGSKSQHQKWPAVLQFGRLIRNAFAHDGKVHITSSQVPPVTWRGIAIGPANNGDPVLFHKLAAADVVILMEDMDAQLH